MSECWRFYALPTASVIFSAKIFLDVFSLSQEQVWAFSVLGDRIYEMRCPFVAVGLNARFIVLPHWDNMSQAHMLTQPVTWADQLCFVAPRRPRCLLIAHIGTNKGRCAVNPPVTLHKGSRQNSLSVTTNKPQRMTNVGD